MRPTFYAALFVGGAVLDWGWNRALGFGGVAPGWLFVLTVSLAATAGPVPAQLLGFGWGLYHDLMAAHLFGAHALALSLAAFVVGRGRRWLDMSGPSSQALLTVLLTLGYMLLLGLLGKIFLGAFLESGWRTFLAVPVMNGVVAPFVFLWLERRARRP